MDHYRCFYAERAEAYQRLVSAEDCDGQLGSALGRIAALEGATVVEVGAGTGRLTRLLLAGGARVIASEPEPAMLKLAQRGLASVPATRLVWHCAPAESLPLEEDVADVALAGWVLGHFCAWYADSWRKRVDAAIGELRRVLRPGGALVIIETLGTAQRLPGPPSEALATYYRHLEQRHGLSCEVVATDYAFDTAEEAGLVMGDFFGATMAARIIASGASRVPEWSGLWHG